MEPVTARTREPSRVAPSPSRISRSAREWGLYALVLVALGLLIIADWRRDLAEREKIAVEQLERDANVVSTLLGSKLRALAAALDGMRGSRFWQRGTALSPADIGDRLEAIARAMDGVRGLHITDRRGIVVASSRSEMLAVDLSGRECFQLLRESTDQALTCLSQPFPAPTGRFTIVVSSMVADLSGRFAGTVIAAIEPAWFVQLMRPLQARGEDLRLSLVHAKGSVVHSEPASGPWSGGDTPVPAEWWPGVKAALSTHSFLGKDHDGRQRQVVVVPVAFDGRVPFAVLASRDRAAIRGAVTRVTLERAFGISVFMAFAAVALFLNQRRRRAVEDAAARASAEREAANERVAEAERDLRLAIEGTGIGVFQWDEARGLLSTSDTFRALFGLAPGEPLTTRTLLSLTDPADRKLVAAAVRRCRDTGARVEFDHRIVRRDGQLRWAHVIVAPVPRPEGGAGRLHGTVLDITDLKALEAEGEQSRTRLAELVEQQVAIQTISAFAHDLNQPLLAIAAYSEAALNTLRRGVTDTARLQRMIEGSHNQALRAGALMHDMSAQLARALEARVDHEPFDMNEVIRLTVKQVGGRRLSVPPPVLELEAGLPRVAGSRVRTSRILENLLINAYQASQRSSNGTSARRVVVSSRQVDGHVEVSVHDFGAGVPPQEAERIFSPFFSTKQSSLGLGLSISRALAESQGGRLELASGSGPGAEFLLTLPLASSHAQDLSH